MEDNELMETTNDMEIENPEVMTDEESGSGLGMFALGAAAVVGVGLAVKGCTAAYNKWLAPKWEDAKQKRKAKKAQKDIDNVKVAEHDFVDSENSNKEN